VLYDPTNEKENCGVGLIASLKSTPSRHVVEVADEMLVRMAHRGGCGSDPSSGDGAGKCIDCSVLTVESRKRLKWFNLRKCFFPSIFSRRS